MKIGVTGGSGFIGSHIVDKLIERGFEVRVLDNRPPHRPDVEYLRTDLTDYSGVLHATEALDYLYHLAAVSNVNDAFAQPIYAVELNAVGTVHILEAARHNRLKRVLFASTVWVYGGAREDNVSEDSPFYMPGAGHVYTSTKIASELFCHDYWELYKVPFTILRYGIPYGPRARAGAVIPEFVKKAFGGEPLTITGDGSQYRNFIYVEDLAEGNVDTLQDVAQNQTYNLEGERPITIKEVAETIQRLMGGKVRIEYLPARPGDYRGKVVSSEKAHQELGWQPKVDFEEGMKRYIEWYKIAML
ncbi:NAD-dependent epimerase/dehydratase family protein [Chloroflexota bacterium]